MTNPIIDAEKRVCADNYLPLPVVLEKGDGVKLWDTQGREYLDMMGAYSAVSFGHSNPDLLAALNKQAQQLAVVSRAYYTPELGPFLQKLCQMTGQEKALPMNTGAEAVETALKAARKWGYKVKGIADNKAEIIACHNNFHGRTISIVGLSSEAQYRDGFGPFPAGLKRIPFNDVDALKKAITKNTCAFLVEPIQGEGGIIVPDDGYLSACKSLCEQNDVLMICDEVQTGLGRTGYLLACEHDAVKPDGLILGKALGGGLLPVSAFLSSQQVMDVFTPGDHGSTFGGNPLASAVGHKVLELLSDVTLMPKIQALGAYFMDQLKTIESPLIVDIRGRGLFIGVEIDASKVSGRQLCERLLEKGVLSKETHESVIRFAPPFVVTKPEIDKVCAVFQQALTELSLD
ncbi:MAG: ornithine--oxo-acid transaminase [Gammaproteobacteria bacterium]|nr:ornithine--oxo-acid transaminase [Gammaproteobacteria bacterium]